MTRIKKTRSLKRIHNVKTGSKQKLKRASESDRQTGKGKKKTLSVYEKYLLEQKSKAKEQEITDKKPKPKEEKEKKPQFKRTTQEQNEKKLARLKTQPTPNKPEENEEDDLFSYFDDNKDTF